MTATLGRPTGAESGLPGESAILPLASRENFTVASLLLGRATRDHLMAIYGFARLVDQLGDEVEGDRLAALDELEREVGKELERMRERGLASPFPSGHVGSEFKD